MILANIFGALAVLSFLLLLWQWLAAMRFPLHRRSEEKSFAPEITLLKPLKGCDETTAKCLRSWFIQDYPGETEIIFGVADAADPVCEIVKKLLAEFPAREARLIICGPLRGANAKVSKLVELEKLARHDVLVISDADVCVPRDFIKNIVAPLTLSLSPSDGERVAEVRERGQIALVNCFYRLANPVNLAMQWEAIAINADFWSQVLQSKSLKPLDFALGAAMAVRRTQLKDIGGFESLMDCLADDYQLGNRIARRGHCIALSPVVAECWSAPMNWSLVWKHQLRWGRTIRVCQPVPYFFSILSNATLWPLLWLVSNPAKLVCGIVTGFLLVRIIATFDLQQRLIQSRKHLKYFWLVPIKDLLQAAIWFCAFAGNRVEWRGVRYRVKRDGTLVRCKEKVTEFFGPLKNSGIKLDHHRDFPRKPES